MKRAIALGAIAAAVLAAPAEAQITCAGRILPVSYAIEDAGAGTRIFVVHLRNQERYRVGFSISIENLPAGVQAIPLEGRPLLHPGVAQGYRFARTANLNFSVHSFAVVHDEGAASARPTIRIRHCWSI